ncbi:SH3 domain-containing protein [Massilia sp. Se16.2.3]|uniref:SH3 domain-containing protein n=1 Tax=Massilia sp. Se16.2.3 TaxID=2709303 RepID=UPI001E5B1DAE|nr:SH3 domain-containing protein [Massilia sp. Se16.2.3]
MAGAAPVRPAGGAGHRQIEAPRPGRSYRVAAPLNLRAAGGTGSPRVVVLPAGSKVETTGRRDGDWWQVSTEVDGVPLAGWASSLWLRRADEGRR